MNRRRACSALLFAAYGVPYAFLCAYGDAMHGTMLGYGVMIAALYGLSRAALRLEAGRMILWGNLLSLGLSLAALQQSGMKEMAWYFKPFTPSALILAIWAAAAAAQGMAWRIGKRRRCRQRKQADK